VLYVVEKEKFIVILPTTHAIIIYEQICDDENTCSISNWFERNDYKKGKREPSIERALIAQC
jgi:hypothetical protein